jgi:hypothetical protein
MRHKYRGSCLSFRLRGEGMQVATKHTYSLDNEALFSEEEIIAFSWNHLSRGCTHSAPLLSS